MSLLTLRSSPPFSLCGVGLVLGTLLFAASLTPSLVPREPWIQGVLGGFCLAVGYGLGVLLRGAWRALQLPALTGRARAAAWVVTLLACALVVVWSLWWAADWQNRLRALMQMPPVDSAGPRTIAILSLLTFMVLLVGSRLVNWTWRRLSATLSRHLATPTATLVAVLITAALFWTVGNGVLVHGVMRAADHVYSGLDELTEDDIAQPSMALQTGGPGSLVDWQRLGRQGRRMVTAGPDRRRIEQMTGRQALDPLRVYVGLNSADSPQARADLALRELQRVGAFQRGSLVVATPTGTGWVDPKSQAALEYLLQGDVATVSVQYSYLASWLALLADPIYGAETARAVFTTVYDHWRRLPRHQRPRLYLHGLSLGALNGDHSHDLFQVIDAPYDGALWSGPPFNTPTWRSVTHLRHADSPAWLPRFGDGEVVRFIGRQGIPDDAWQPWRGYRVVFLQYASDPVTFFDPQSVWRRPDWMVGEPGPDVSPDIRWIPVVTFLQLAFDMIVAGQPPRGHGHMYAFEHYVDAWASLATSLSDGPVRVSPSRAGVPSADAPPAQAERHGAPLSARPLSAARLPVWTLDELADLKRRAAAMRPHDGDAAAAPGAVTP